VAASGVDAVLINLGRGHNGLSSTALPEAALGPSHCDDCDPMPFASSMSPRVAARMHRLPRQHHAVHLDCLRAIRAQDESGIAPTSVAQA
jgi:hypothetical protein